MTIRLSNIHETLAEQRKRLGISQQELADALHIEQSSVSHYETGSRRVPIEILDAWLAMLDIEITITPKGYEKTRDEELTKRDLEEFEACRRRRNFLTAELRSMMARRVMSEPYFQAELECSGGEGAFWPYALGNDWWVEVLENRVDHPLQRHMAVSITDEGAYVHRFMGGVAPQPEGPGRAYMTETDFLTISGQVSFEELEATRSTLLRVSDETPGGTQVVNAEGFALGPLLKIQESLTRFAAIYDEVTATDEHREMLSELTEIDRRMMELELDNRLANGTPNPAFELWTEKDQSAVDVPLWSPDRVWEWKEEGVSWVEIEEE